MKNRRTILATATLLILVSAPSQAAKTGPTSTPQITCAGATQASINVHVCAGATGAPAGFSIQWMTASDYASNGNAWYLSDDPRLGKASFSGNANLSRYNLAAGECVTVNIGDLLFDNGASTNNTGALSCGTEYVFRSFAHATSTINRSDFTDHLFCSTLPCGNAGGCTSPPNYWRSYNPQACVTNPGTILCVDWPVSSLTLGTITYTVDQLVAILNTPASGNGLIALAHQLIAAKLNIANGANPSAVNATIAAADASIGALVVGTDFLDPGVTAAYTTTLANYNEGAIGPGLCAPPDPGQD
ncbi:MAG TPA: hypothetical protein VLV78_21405 [Thermoanaerobaculia bacterium]|nr:hypothetical protein [Thermoanaerobaculia bacterium]